MEFIIDQADVSDNDLYSDESTDNEGSTPSDDDFFTDNEEVIENYKSIYREFNNREEFHKFKNQIKNPVEEHQNQTSDFYGDDDLSEMSSPGDRDYVEFDTTGTKERANSFKKTLKRFDNIENHFFYSVVYGLMFVHKKARI